MHPCWDPVESSEDSVTGALIAFQRLGTALAAVPIKAESLDHDELHLRPARFAADH